MSFSLIFLLLLLGYAEALPALQYRTSLSRVTSKKLSSRSAADNGTQTPSFQPKTNSFLYTGNGCPTSRQPPILNGTGLVTNMRPMTAILNQPGIEWSAPRHCQFDIEFDSENWYFEFRNNTAHYVTANVSLDEGVHAYFTESMSNNHYGVGRRAMAKASQKTN